ARSVTNPEGEETTFVFDAHRNLVSTTDAENRTTGYVYDPADQMIQVDRADGTDLVTDYWPDGSLKPQIDGAGQATGYVYDTADRLTSVTDPLGRVTNYKYDHGSRMVEKREPGASPAGCFWGPSEGCTKYIYNDANNLTAVSYS